jgi:DNA-binding IclR family transcriptional regulator
MNIVQMVTIFKALMQGPASRLDLSERTGVPPKTVGKLLTELKKQKMIYVIDYSNESDGRNRVKLFTFGDGEDAQPRQSQPQAERSRKSYVKKVRAIEAASIRTTFAGGKSLWQ